MRFIGWMYDIAREQSPREDLLEEMLRRSAAAGYNAVGFYLEHRFAYASAPWAAGPGCLTPEAVRRLVSSIGCSAANGTRTTGLRIIPFLNTLGHMEGFIRSEGGQWLAEGEAGFGGEQMCATRPECVGFVRDLVVDTLAAFDDEWVHLGGDETRQLGQCPQCAERVARIGKGGLYGEHFGSLCRFVLERGRRPCLWGDMLLQHPDALDAIPRETVIFDWQYFSRPRQSTRRFRERGFDVVCCPNVQTYNAGWCFLAHSQRNIDEHAEEARAAGALGVLVTTWEFRHFTQYAATLPLIYAAGRRLAHGEDWTAALLGEGGGEYTQAAEILGNRIPAATKFLQPGTWRKLREYFVLRQNPFCLWNQWREEACGAAGDEILRLCAQAENLLPADNPLHFAVELHRVAVEWVRVVERASAAYANGRLSVCAQELNRSANLLERLRPGLERAAAAGGSAADVQRLQRLTQKVEQAVMRVRQLPAASAHRPAFATLVHDAHIVCDQAAWRTTADR
ncbi:MAG: family 20 glycosylhydrolase [Phycisphaerae bacterium]|nr:family 20 glycosylhydrolase [Phycisphaerae bacterium]